VSRGTLFAVPFDPVKLEISGSPKPMLQQVSYSAMFGSAKLSFFAHRNADIPEPRNRRLACDCSMVGCGW
jgi:hypothetical protein